MNLLDLCRPPLTDLCLRLAARGYVSRRWYNMPEKIALTVRFVEWHCVDVRHRFR